MAIPSMIGAAAIFSMGRVYGTAPTERTAPAAHAPNIAAKA
jgi:hypothetical protein